MDLAALANCLTSASCIVTQTTSGLIIGLLLFLVAAGVSLIFGVLKVVNFAHGSFYMLGAYFAYTAFQLSGNYLVAVLAGGIGVAIFGLLFERLLMSRVYGSPVLMQLLVCYGVILILDDVVKIVWGASFLSFGMPETFQTLPILFAGGVVPVFYLFLIVATLVIGAILGLVITKTRYGKIVRAAAVNPNMVSALGLNTSLIYASVFVIGGLLAGLAGGLAAPVRSLVSGMGTSVVIESFIVTVIGGMGSVAGALVGSLLIGLVRSFGTIGFPLFTEGLMFLMMAVVLIVKPSGLFGKDGGLSHVEIIAPSRLHHCARRIRHHRGVAEHLPEQGPDGLHGAVGRVRHFRDVAEHPRRLRRHGKLRARSVLRAGLLQLRPDHAKLPVRHHPRCFCAHDCAQYGRRRFGRRHLRSIE